MIIFVISCGHLISYVVFYTTYFLIQQSPTPENVNRFVTLFNEIAYGIPEEIF
jgi:hypothetical protein